MAEAAFDLARPQRVHIVGLGGAAMVAIASILRTMGHQVSGSDLRDSRGLERLRALGVEVHIGHDEANVGDVDAVMISTAVPPGNPEVLAARGRGIPVLRRSEAQAAIAATRRTVAVAGTHGKTTTSSMLALVLLEAGLDPSFLVGGEIHEVGSGAVWGDGDLFVIEADESDGTFIELGAEAALLTSVEPDHLEHWGSWDALRAAFEQFVVDAAGPRVVCIDDPEASAIATSTGAVSYGTSPGARYRIAELETARRECSFQLEIDGAVAGLVTLPMPGVHNARNAAGALAMGMELGVSFADGARALARYAGVARRFQFRGEAGGVTVVEDYAHLPGEIAPVIAAARAGGWDRVVVLFQPHRYSRTEALWRDFHHAFDGADAVVITDIYPADETPRPGITGRLVADAVLGAADPTHTSESLTYVTERSAWVPTTVAHLRPGDVCLVLGAGDVPSVVPELLDALAAT